MTKEEYKRRKENGLCTKCGKPNDNGKTSCDDCRIRTKMKNMKRVYEDGKCARCGNEIDTDGTMCSSCRKLYREREKIRRDERKANGLCPRCGKPHSSKNVYCDDCLAVVKKSKMQYMSMGICPTCRRNKIYLNEKECFDCREKHLVANRRNYYANREKYLEQHKIKDRARRDYRVENGICIRCGNKADSGFKTCGRCREKYSKPRRTPRPDGICRCGQPNVAGYKVCADCRSRLTEIANLPQTKMARKEYEKRLKQCFV